MGKGSGVVFTVVSEIAPEADVPLSYTGEVWGHRTNMLNSALALNRKKMASRKSITEADSVQRSEQQ